MNLVSSLLAAFVLLGGAACASKNGGHAIVGRWLLAAGGANERAILDLKADRSYSLRHWVEFHDIHGEDLGSWSLIDGVIALTPAVRGTAQGEVFLPHHCARLQIATYEKEMALVSVSVPIVPYTIREHAIFLKENRLSFKFEVRQ